LKLNACDVDDGSYVRKTVVRIVVKVLMGALKEVVIMEMMAGMMMVSH
jgi:hypothetical protein